MKFYDYAKKTKLLNESGIRNIKDLAKKYNKAEIYFHIDLDGVTSAIAMKSYLGQYGIKTVDVHKIQYGNMEYAINKGKTETLKVLVDFAHGKSMFHIHTDHHEGQVGVEKDTSTSFKHSKSNVETISGELSPKDIFPPSDLKVISMVDSADFAANNIKPSEVFNAIFTLNKSKSVEKNHLAMGLVVNKLLLTYKNKPNFLESLVLQSQPSLISMYNVIVKLAKQEGFKSFDDIKGDTLSYIEKQKSKIKTGSLSDVKNLKSGESILIGNTIIQNNAGYMGKGNQYDRYVVFNNHPNADYFSILGSVGLLQLSQNPFKKLDKDLHLGDIVMKKIMPKFKSKLQKIDVSLDYVKFVFERDIISKKLENTVGFTFNDLVALYDKEIKNLPKDEKSSYRKMIVDITNKPYSKLSGKQKSIIKKITVSAGDLIMSGSGGHRAITNLSGVNFIQKKQYPGGYVQLLKDIQYEIAKYMQKV